MEVNPSRVDTQGFPSRLSRLEIPLFIAVHELPKKTWVIWPGKKEPEGENPSEGERKRTGVSMNESAIGKHRTVSVSAVITAALCPMRLYLESRSGEPRQESYQYTICKQISSHLGSTLDPGMIWDEVVAIIPHADPVMHEFMDACIARCTEGGPWRAFTDADMHIHAEKHGLSGNIDKVHDQEPFLSIVRSMHAPPAGVYTSDRLRVFGYMLLMNETLGLDVQEGLVEYIPSGTVRSCIPGPIDKRRFLKAMRDARTILSGKEPPRPHGVKCQTCESLDACRPSGKRLSDLL